jgi:GNAT superfamily N-acetyltransferase
VIHPLFEIEVRRIQPSDIATVAEIMSHAYLDNPSHIAIYQGKSETERIIQEIDFKNYFHHNPLETYVAKHEECILGFICSIDCTGTNTPFDKEEYDYFVNTKIERLSVDERHKWRMMVWGKHDPDTLHSHLGPFGVLPDFQGKGIGSRLLKEYFVRVDRAGLASYLETGTLENVRFYEKHGYNIVDTAYALGIKQFFMWRDAHAV